MSLGNTAFGIGRRIGKHPLAGRIFCLAERWLPLKRVARTHTLVAFHHPRSIANPHVLIVPTRPLPSLTAPMRSSENRAETIWQMVILAREIGLNMHAAAAWQMVINGGNRQDIGQMHGHLLLDHTSPTASDAIDSAGDLLPFLERLRDIARVPDAGYSLVIRWKEDGDVWAIVTSEG